MGYDTDSDCVSVTVSQSHSGYLHTVEQINGFLNETFRKAGKASNYFPDAEKTPSEETHDKSQRDNRHLKKKMFKSLRLH